MTTSSTAPPKPIVLAFATAKGGMGKTTLSVIVASYMHYKMGVKAAILDVDGSQLSVYNQRLREAENLSEEGKLRLMERQEKEGIDAYQILSGYPGDVPKLLKHLPDGTQLVFVDLPGNIEIVGYDLALKEVDLLIVPMETSEYSVTTGFQYLSAIKQIGLLPLTNCWILWNKYKPSRDGAQADQLEEVFQSHGFQCLKSRVPARDSYQDPANRSTLFAMPTPYLRNSGLKDLFSELEDIIQKITPNK
ncbi:ParA family protein [Larkinella sp. C7]|uniref:ParA family protein n=1 Tax=Larkinella sp. C7 TaxID=2576607 RepID=UPI001110FCA4|nr:ParA family protein [Larkinella sp. C7]